MTRRLQTQTDARSFAPDPPGSAVTTVAVASSGGGNMIIVTRLNGSEIVVNADLIETVEGPVDDGRCVLGDGPCPAPRPCALHDAWIPARDALTERLAGIPLSNLDQEVTP